MANISEYIESINAKNEKVLSVFLTSGFPEKESFVDLACGVFDSGADMIEIGFPFSDPLADGPVIQHSSQLAIESGINITKTFEFVELIKKKHNKPVIMMGYANPVMKYGIKEFANDAVNCGVDGVIIPDIPVEEYDEFYGSNFNKLDVIMLITPTTSNDRIIEIDNLSSGFVYCVSVSGTTGVRDFEKSTNTRFISNAHSLIKKNKMLVGFGISTADDVKRFSPFCDGVIVGSAVIKSLINSNNNYNDTYKLISSLKTGCV